MCLNLVNEDANRDGFLDGNTISQVITRLGMKINSKQLQKLVQVLRQNAKQEFCYMEMISLLLGEEVMVTLMREQGIDLEGTKPKKKVDMSLIKLSESLKDQIELKLGLL